MSQPIFLVVHDDARVLDRLVGDLDRRFGADYRVEGERSPAAALFVLIGAEPHTAWLDGTVVHEYLAEQMVVPSGAGC